MSIDELIETSPQSSIFVRPWWLDAVAPGKWEYITVESGDEIVAAMPIVKSGRNILMPELTQTLGIIFRPFTGSYPRQISLRQKYSMEIIEKLPSFRSFCQCFHYNYTDWLPFYWKGFRQTTRYTYVLNNVDQDRVWLGMRKGIRRYIGKAESELDVRLDLPIEDFHTICKHTYDKMGRSYPLKVINRIERACREKDARWIISALSRSGELISSVYLVGDKKSIYYIISGTKPRNQHPGATALLLWRGIQETASVSSVFDFEGSMIQNISDNFRRFGGIQKPYSMIWVDSIISSIKKRMHFLKALVRWRI